VVTVTGPGNYSEAVTILNDGGCDYGCPHTGCAHEMAYLARAQVHATLALAAAVIAGARQVMKLSELQKWDKAIDPEYEAAYEAALAEARAAAHENPSGWAEVAR
jgi:hypothetical protein